MPERRPKASDRGLEVRPCATILRITVQATVAVGISLPGTMRRVVLRVVDGVGLVHAMILRIQALLYPIQTLVLGGH